MYSKTTIVGHLGQDPEMQYTQKGTERTKFSVAVNTGSGDYERTDWFNVTCWGATAENSNQYLSKGSRVLVEGEMRNDKWTDDEGNNRSTWSLNANRVVFLTPKQDGRKAQEVPEDDIPF